MPHPAFDSHDIRKGQASVHLGRDEFSNRLRAGFDDDAFKTEGAAIARLEDTAWQANDEDHKSPHKQKAWPGFANPDYDISAEWMEFRARLPAAQHEVRNIASAAAQMVAHLPAGRLSQPDRGLKRPRVK